MTDMTCVMKNKVKGQWTTGAKLRIFHICMFFSPLFLQGTILIDQSDPPTGCLPFRTLSENAGIVGPNLSRLVDT